MAELWDAYNRDFTKKEGVTLIRGEEIPEGCYHLVCDIVVKHTDGTYLLMQRDPNKMHGGMWELSAGGSVIQGEDVYDGACRELQEETGVTGELVELGRVVQDENRSLYVIYLCETSCAKDSIVLQEGETVDYKWVSREELLAMAPEVMLSQRAIRVLLEQNL